MRALLLQLLFEGGVAGLIYKFGFLRSEMQHAKRDVAAQLAQIRDEAKARDSQLHARVDSLEATLRERFDRVDLNVASLLDSRVESEHRAGGMESTIEAHDQRLEQLERAVMRSAPRVAT